MAVNQLRSVVTITDTAYPVRETITISTRLAHSTKLRNLTVSLDKLIRTLKSKEVRFGELSNKSNLSGG